MLPMYGPSARGATASAGRRAVSHTSVSCNWYKNAHARRVAMGVLPSVYGRSDLPPEPRWVKLLDQTRCIGCHACTTACKSENEVPVGVTGPTSSPSTSACSRRSGGRSRSPAATSARTRRAWRRARPGHVPARGRHRRLRQGHLHRLQGVHGRLPVRRDLHQPRGPLGGEVQPLRAPPRRRPRAGLRHRLPHRGDPRRRPERPRRQGRPGDQPRAGAGARGRRRTPGPASSTRARTRRRSTRWPRGGRTAACSRGPPRALRIRSSSRRGTRAGRCPRRRRCCPTTCRTTRRGAGGSACTPGPSRSRPAASRCRSRWPSPGSCPGGTPPPAGPRRCSRWRSWRSPAPC